MVTTSRLRARSAAAKEAKARKVMRIVAITGGILVVAVAGYASYFHIVELTVRHGQSESIGHLMPIAIDGLMIVSAVAVIAQRYARLPKVAFIIGAFLTLGANILSVQTPDVIAYVIAGTPAVTLLLSADLLLRLCLPVPAKRKVRARPKAHARTPLVVQPA